MSLDAADSRVTWQTAPEFGDHHTNNTQAPPNEKSEPRFRSNQWSRETLVHCQTNKGKFKFVTESKIGVLYSDLAKQSYKPFGDFVAKMTPTNR